MYLKNQKGMALPLVIIISMFLIILGSGMLIREIGETKFRVNDEDKTQAYYLARSGADAIYDVFVNDHENALQLLRNNKYTAAPTSFAGGEISIEVEDNRTVQEDGHNKNEILVHSTGTINNETAIVVLALKFTPGEMGYNVFQYPIYAKSDMSLGAVDFNFSEYGTGKIATEVSDDGTIYIHSGANVTEADVDFEVDGSMYTTPIFPVGTNIGDISMTNGDHMVIEKDPASGKVRLQVNNGVDFDSGWLDGNIYLPNFTANGGDIKVYIPHDESLKMISDNFYSKVELEIITIDDDGSLWVDDYPMVGDDTPDDPTDDTGEYDFEALQTYTGEIDGVFELYAYTSMVFQTGASVIANTPNSFFAVLDDGADFQFIANGEFNGYIYGPGAHVDIQAAGSEFCGAVISDYFEISNNADYMFYPFFMTDIPSGFMDSLNYGITIESWR